MKNLGVSPRLQLALLAAVSLVALAMSWQGLDERRRAYDAARMQLERAAGQAAQIKLLRLRPDRATSQSRSAQALAEAIERTAKDAGIENQQIARIEPQPARRVGDTDYLEQPTAVQLDGVTLVQLATWLNKLKQGELRQLRCAAIRIAAPFQTTGNSQETPKPEAWNVEVTLTDLVYSPKNRPAKPI